jgi:hypothetical protein
MNAVIAGLSRLRGSRPAGVPAPRAAASPERGVACLVGAQERAALLRWVAGILELAAQQDPVNGPAAGLAAADIRAQAALVLGGYHHTITPVADGGDAEATDRDGAL